MGGVKKEIILAIGVGFVVGLLITYGVWQANKAISLTKTIAPEKEETIESQPTPETKKSVLNLISPPNELLTKEPKVTLRGNYIPNAQIAIVQESQEKIIKVDASGAFETEITLTPGENQLEIYGFTKDGDEARQILTIIHSTAEL